MSIVKAWLRCLKTINHRPNIKDSSIIEVFVSSFCNKLMLQWVDFFTVLKWHIVLYRHDFRRNRFKSDGIHRFDYKKNHHPKMIQSMTIYNQSQFKLSHLVAICLSATTFSISALAEQNAAIQIGGRMQWDYDYFNGVHNGGKSGSGTELRRGRIFVKKTLNKDWQGKLQIEVNDTKKEVQFQDAYVKYNGWNGIDLIFGKAKEHFGLEAMESNKYLAFIERAQPSDAFAPYRSYGITLFRPFSNATVAGGVYVQDQDEDNQEIYAWTGRLTYAPIVTTDSVIHFGLSGSIRDWGGHDYQINRNAEVHLADKVVQSGQTAADTVTVLGLAAAAVFGPLSVRTEYMKADVEAASDLESNSADYQGYYIQTSYFLTGESYSYKKGRFVQYQPRGNGGAWQLAARFSHLDANDNNEGVEADNFSFGVNYYVNPNIRFSANYLLTEIGESNAALTENDGDALSFRFQYLF
jgi:phosphate-selective porin OprO/OprP